MNRGLTVRGYVREGDSTPDAFEQLYGSQVVYRRRREVTAQAAGGRGELRAVELALDGADDDVLEIETSDGLVHFTTVGGARAEARPRGTSSLDELIAVRRGASPSGESPCPGSTSQTPRSRPHSQP